MSTKGTVNVVHLYPREMTIYGDLGNTRCITARLTRHGYTPNLINHHPGDDLPKDTHLLLGGGGQDSGQARVEEDFFKHADLIRSLAADGVPMMMICGTYQLFGNSFLTVEGAELSGLGILDVTTKGNAKRMIGPSVLDTEFGQIVGYENHSGSTQLSASQKSFGTVRHGFGNNGEDGTGGARTNNVFGHYLHGPVLPANPAFADALIGYAVELATGRPFEPEQLNDHTADEARTRQINRLLG